MNLGEMELPCLARIKKKIKDDLLFAHAQSLKEHWTFHPSLHCFDYTKLLAATSRLCKVSATSIASMQHSVVREGQTTRVISLLCEDVRHLVVSKPSCLSRA